MGWGRARQRRASHPLGALPSRTFPRFARPRRMPPIASQLIAGLGESWEEKAEGDGMHDYDIRSKIGLRIKELRAERGVSQEEFANLIGMSRSYFGEVETGRRNVAAVNLEKIAKGLGVSLAEFFDSEFFGER